MSRVLSNAEIAAYQRDGYLAYDRLLSESEVDAILDRATNLVETQWQGVRVQIEPRVVSGEAEAVSKLAAIRKIEGLVENDDLFLNLARHPLILGRIQDLLGSHVKMFRDAMMMKPPRVGSEKPYHQDSAYWSVEPMDLCSVWIALDDATLENGCMRVLPGTHLGGVVEHKSIRDFQVDESSLDLASEASVPLRRGGALFFHSLLLHATSDNHSDKARRAMIVSYMRGDSRFTGPADRAPNYLVVSE